jgi:hypothetical protein
MRDVALKNASGMSPSKGFVTFSLLSDAHFLGVASDSSLVFDSSFGSLKQILLLVRAKEIAQALLPEAIRKSKIPSREVVEAHKVSEQVANAVQCASAPEPPTSDPGTSDGGAKSQPKQREKRKKHKADAQVLGPRLNLQNTPTRQARANHKVIQ